MIPHEFSGIDVSVIDVDIAQPADQAPAAKAAAFAERLLAKAQGKDVSAAADVADLAALLNRNTAFTDAGLSAAWSGGTLTIRGGPLMTRRAAGRPR